MASKKGIITLTLVISRESESPMVMRGAFVMFHIFKIKTKLELQVEEYLEWKAKFSKYSSNRHREVLIPFIKRLNYKDVSEILLTNIQNFYLELPTNFTKTQFMIAIRGFLGYFRAKKQANIHPKSITNQGVQELTIVGTNDMIEPMIKRKRGRPLNIELVKKVQRLRDQSGEPKLPFRTIAIIVKKDLKSTYRLYKYKVPKESSLA